MKIVGGSLYVAAVLLNLLAFLAAPALAKTAVQCSPNTISFGKQKLPNAANPNSSSPPQTITIHSKGPTISDLSFSLSGSDPKDFQKSTDCPTDLGMGKNCHVTVTFIPTRTQKRLATLIVAYQGNPDAQTVKLSGTGVQTGNPIVPQQVDFGKVPVGTTSPPKTISVKNRNSVSIEIESIVTSGPFAVVPATTTCGSLLGAGQSCKVTMTFTPKNICQVGLQIGKLSIVTDAASVPAQTELIGTAIQNAPNAIFVSTSVDLGKNSSNTEIFGGAGIAIFAVTANGNVPPIGGIFDPQGLNFPTGVAVDSSSNIYVANTFENSVTVYAACASPAAGPIATIIGNETGLNLPQGIALDSKGNIYVSNSEGPSGANVTVYPPLGNSVGTLNEMPLPALAISGAGTGLSDPSGLAFDSAGNIYVANANGGPDGLGSITIYSRGSVMPLATISDDPSCAPCDNTKLNNPSGVVLDSLGNIYVSNRSGSVTVYQALGSSTGTINKAPIATIAGNNTGLNGPSGIALDSVGHIYVSNDSASSVTVYPPLGSISNSNVEPIKTLSGMTTDLAQPAGIALDKLGDVYVTNSMAAPDASVTIYQPLLEGSGSDQPPIDQLGFNVTGFDEKFEAATEGIAVDPSSGDVYVTNRYPISILFYPAGTFGKSSPTAVIAGSNTFLGSPTSIALDQNKNIYVADQFPNIGPSLYQAAVFVYPPIGGRAGTLNEFPQAIITGFDDGLLAPIGIALDSVGNIYVANCGHCVLPPPLAPPFPQTVTVYPALGSRTGVDHDAPIATISGFDFGCNVELPPFSDGGMALDSTGKIYVTDCASVMIFPPLSSVIGNPAVTPIATIEGSMTQLFQPEGIALDSEGNIYVANVGSQDAFLVGSINVYQPLGSNTGSLNWTPKAMVTGDLTGVGLPNGIAIGPLSP